MYSTWCTHDNNNRTCINTVWFCDLIFISIFFALIMFLCGININVAVSTHKRCYKGNFRFRLLSHCVSLHTPCDFQLGHTAFRCVTQFEIKMISGMKKPGPNWLPCGTTHIPIQFDSVCHTIPSVLNFEPTIIITSVSY